MGIGGTIVSRDIQVRDARSNRVDGNLELLFESFHCLGFKLINGSEEEVLRFRHLRDAFHGSLQYTRISSCWEFRDSYRRNSRNVPDKFASTL